MYIKRRRLQIKYYEFGVEMDDRVENICNKHLNLKFVAFIIKFLFDLFSGKK